MLIRTSVIAIHTNFLTSHLTTRMVTIIQKDLTLVHRKKLTLPGHLKTIQGLANTNCPAYGINIDV